MGGFPTGISLDPLTDTIYVGNGTTDSLSLIDGRSCNALTTRGCGQRVTAVTAGTDPIGSVVDTATDTVYAVNASSGTVAVIDGRRCHAGAVQGCRATPPTVPVGSGPELLSLDAATQSLYVANFNANTVSVINARTCSDATTAGCGRPTATVAVGPKPFAVAVDQSTDSVYVTDAGSTTVSVIDGRACSAVVTAGCARRPLQVNVGTTPGGLAVDTTTDTIYVTAETSDDVSVIDGRTCNATVVSGCRERPLRVLAGSGARGIAVNQTTDTVYVANTRADTVSVINGAICNAAVRSGCGQRAATALVGASPRRVAVDELTNTVDVTDANANAVTMLDGRTCDARVHSGC